MINTKSNVVLPQIGLGTYPLRGEDASKITFEAIKIGYRIIDTSDDYLNEADIGIGVRNAVSDGLVKREELFLQTKITDMCSFQDDFFRGTYFNRYSSFQNSHSVSEIVKEKVYVSLRLLKTDYLDSVLIHLPYYGYYEAIWEELCNLKAKGLIRYIGVSNCHEKHISKLRTIAELPAINEIYISPIGSKEEDVCFCKENGIEVMSYSPLIDIAHGRLVRKPFEDMMQKYNKTFAQIVLRWNIDRGIIPLPKSSKVNRLKENFDVFDFSLTKEEIIKINSLNYDYQYLVESKIAIGI